MRAGKSLFSEIFGGSIKQPVSRILKHHIRGFFRKGRRCGFTKGMRRMAEKHKYLVILGITLAVYLGIRFLLPYVIPFFIAWILVAALNPLLVKIRKRLPWKKEILAGILLTVFLALGGVLFYFFCGAVMKQLARVMANFDHYYQQICAMVDDCCGMVERKAGIRDGGIRLAVDRQLEQAAAQFEEKMVPDVLNHSVQYLMKALNGAGFLFLVFIGVLLLIKDYEEIIGKLERYPFFVRVRRISRRISHTGGTYLRSQFLIMGIISAMCVAGLYLLGNSYALLLGIVIGILDALPFLGTGTVLLPWAVVLLIQKKYALALGYAGLFLITNTVRELLEPKLIGRRIGIYPFVMAFSVYAGLCLFGPTGVFTGPAGLVLIQETCREILGESAGERHS